MVDTARRNKEVSAMIEGLMTANIATENSFHNSHSMSQHVLIELIFTNDDLRKKSVFHKCQKSSDRCRSFFIPLDP